MTTENSVNNPPSPPVLDIQTRRTLSKGMKVMNFFYKLLLGLLSAVNFTLIMFDKTVDSIHISETYFQVISVIIAIVPIFWSKLLDSCKSINVSVPPSPTIPTRTISETSSQAETSSEEKQK